MSSPGPTPQDEKLFEVALDTRNFEISLFWQRSNYFLVLNTALAVGFFSVKEKRYAMVLAGLGAIAALLWFFVNLGSKYWQSRWEHELTLRERRLRLDEPLFAANRHQTDRYVRESLRYHDHSRLYRLVDRMVLLKPSVSFMMTVLSVVFLLAWVGLFVERSQLLFGLTWTKPDGIALGAFALSVLASLTAIAIVYLLYLASAAYARRRIAKAHCWWLPGANTFRFVIRNIPRKANLFGIRYRAWLRKDVSASDEMSVRTFIDTELAKGERLLLPGGQDQTVICFRLDAVDQDLNLIVTDKMGNPQDSRPIDDPSTRLMVEFSVRARTWPLFKHEISRLYAIPQSRTLNGQRHDVFREYLLPMQSSGERQMKSVLQYADEVTVTI
jgi:hypothetical protein